MEIGADDYILKPFKEVKGFDAIRAQLETWRQGSNYDSVTGG